MAGFRETPPAYYWVASALLALWSAIGCYFCYMQFTLGAEAMGPATEYDRALYAALPGWYNWCYAVAVGAGLVGGIALLARAKVARPVLLVSLIAIAVQFGYLFATTDLIAHKGVAATCLFPAFIFLVDILAWWFAGVAQKRGWTS